MAEALVRWIRRVQGTTYSLRDRNHMTGGRSSDVVMRSVQRAAHSLSGWLSDARLALLSAVAVIALYWPTLMRTISGCTHEYCLDVGEFQVALPIWGTVHYTGYPLYMLLGSPFVVLLRALGVPPAMGASVYSLLWEVLAVVGLVLVVRRLTGRALLAVIIGLGFAALEPVWVHAVLAEVYSMSLALCMAIIAVALALHERWSDRCGWLLALLLGLAVAHHRLNVCLLLPVGLYLLPTALRSTSVRRWLAPAGLWFAAGFLPYVDIPLRIWLGSTWNYDQANTWQGFWRVFRGTEVAWLQRPGLTLPALELAAKDIGRVLLSDLTPLGLVLIALGVVQAARGRQTRSAAWFFGGIVACYLLFALVFRQAVLLQATLLTALLALCALLGIGLGSIRSDVLRAAAGIICLGWAGWLIVRNQPSVSSLTRDRAGVVYADAVQQLDAPAGSIVMAPWGTSYFALAYAQRVEGRLAQWRIVDHRADFRGLSALTSPRVFTHWSTLYIFGWDWWTERLGSPLRIVSAGPDMLMLTASPLERGSGSGIRLNDGILLDHWTVAPLDQGRFDVVLYWVATHTPSADYSTFVHASDQDVSAQPQALVAQSDYSMPVHGWYPTTRWIPGEIVREDHVLQVPPERSLQTITVGMYSQDSSGAFHSQGTAALQYREGKWESVP